VAWNTVIASDGTSYLPLSGGKTLVTFINTHKAMDFRRKKTLKIYIYLKSSLAKQS